MEGACHLLWKVIRELGFSRLLLVDTPRKEGIDEENLNKILEQFKKSEEVANQAGRGYQIIMTTVVDTYPEEFKDAVFLTLKDDSRLLNKIN